MARLSEEERSRIDDGLRNRIKELAIAAGIRTAWELHDRCGIKRETAYRLWDNPECCPKRQTIVKLCRELDCSPGDLLYLREIS